MFFKKYSRLCALGLCATLFILVLFISCTTYVKKDDQPFNNRISAEYSMMKKRLPLIERENDILKKENLQHRKTIKDLEAQIKGLDLELTSLRDKYAHDMAISEERISSQQETIQAIKQESDERIETLKALNNALETKLSREVRVLNGRMAKQKEAFDQEHQQIIQENAKRESYLSTQLNDLKKTLEPKELEIASLKKAVTEISIQLAEATALSKALKKARDDSMAELESEKAAKAELIKKMNALSHELSVQNKQPKTNH